MSYKFVIVGDVIVHVYGMRTYFKKLNPCKSVNC